MHKKRFRHAFTMIELIFVIIILGILAAVALPRFVGIQDDAKISAEKGTAGAVRGGIALSHGKWLLKQGATNDWDSDTTLEEFTGEGYLKNLDTGEANPTTALTTGIFAEILTEAASEWTRSAPGDSNGTYEGPASKATGVSNTGTNDINSSGEWNYDSSTGVFAYGN